eukprot:4217921-Pleurochrysis_carterae.AAC.1
MLARVPPGATYNLAAGPSTIFLRASAHDCRMTGDGRRCSQQRAAHRETRDADHRFRQARATERERQDAQLSLQRQLQSLRQIHEVHEQRRQWQRQH